MFRVPGFPTPAPLSVELFQSVATISVLTFQPIHCGCSKPHQLLQQAFAFEPAIFTTDFRSGIIRARDHPFYQESCPAQATTTILVVLGSQSTALLSHETTTISHPSRPRLLPVGPQLCYQTSFFSQLFISVLAPQPAALLSFELPQSPQPASHHFFGASLSAHGSHPFEPSLSAGHHNLGNDFSAYGSHQFELCQILQPQCSAPMPDAHTPS